MVKGVGAGADLWGQILALPLASSFLLSVLSAPFFQLDFTHKPQVQR